MTRFPIPGLTKSQREVFEQVAAGNYSLAGFFRPAAVRKLLEAGAIVPCGEKVVCQDRFGTVKVPEYEVPIGLHIAWCEWCERNFENGNPRESNHAKDI